MGWVAQLPPHVPYVLCEDAVATEAAPWVGPLCSTLRRHQAAHMQLHTAEGSKQEQSRAAQLHPRLYGHVCGQVHQHTSGGAATAAASEQAASGRAGEAHGVVGLARGRQPVLLRRRGPAAVLPSCAARANTEQHSASHVNAVSGYQIRRGRAGEAAPGAAPVRVAYIRHAYCVGGLTARTAPGQPYGSPGGQGRGAAQQCSLQCTAAAAAGCTALGATQGLGFGGLQAPAVGRSPVGGRTAWAGHTAGGPMGRAELLPHRTAAGSVQAAGGGCLTPTAASHDALLKRCPRCPCSCSALRQRRAMPFAASRACSLGKRPR